jgi:nitroimidazol reductase NimA-like FMN-containing flavoprotein (pyridoxamine 5'-phosphate oxidase superfamily)
MTYVPTARTELHRRKSRGTYDRQTVHAILDEALVCHLGFVAEGQPYVLPTAFVREDESLYVHGAAASRALRTLAAGVPACVTVTLLDGLVLARSAFHHSMNYRSVVVLGTAREIAEGPRKLRAMSLLVDKVSPGRWSRVRAPSAKELSATSLLELPLVEVSAKVRAGPPLDDPEDAHVSVWAGVIPLALGAKDALPENEGHPPPALPEEMKRRMAKLG